MHNPPHNLQGNLHRGPGDGPGHLPLASNQHECADPQDRCGELQEPDRKGARLPRWQSPGDVGPTGCRHGGLRKDHSGRRPAESLHGGGGPQQLLTDACV